MRKISIEASQSDYRDSNLDLGGNAWRKHPNPGLIAGGWAFWESGGLFIVNASSGAEFIDAMGVFSIESVLQGCNLYDLFSDA